MKKIIVVALFVLLCFSHQLPAQIISTVAGGGTTGIGDNGPALDAIVVGPNGLAIDNGGNLYISGRNDNRIRKVNSSGIITTIAGTGTPGHSGDGAEATAAEIYAPYGVAVDNSGNIYFADGGNSCIRKINTVGVISTIAGNDTFGYNGDNIQATVAELNSPSGVAVDAVGNVYIADGYNNRIRKINTSGIITTIAGTGIAGHSGDNGLATNAEINGPYTILLDGSGNIYIGEEFGNCVRKINNAGIITTIAGTGTSGFSGDNGSGTAAKITSIFGLAMDAGGNLYISDNLNYRVRRVSPSGIITTYAGDGNGDYNGDGLAASAAQLDPAGLALDSIGNLYIADFGNDRVRRITSTVVSVNNVNTPTENILVYPNPTNGDFTISISSPFDEQALVIITNMAGGKIEEFTTATNKPTGIVLDLSPGIYFLTAITAHGRWSDKLMVSPS